MSGVPDWVWVAAGWCAVVFGASGVLFELLGEGTCELTDAYVTYHGSMLASMRWTADGQSRALANLKDVKIEIAGSPAGAFYRYEANPKIERRAWAGRVVIEPEVVPRD